MRGHTDRAEAEMAVHVTALTKPIGELIDAVLRKHHRAVLEAVKELHERATKAESERDEARARAERAEERERCAVICDNFHERKMVPAECAGAIRAIRAIREGK